MSDLLVKMLACLYANFSTWRVLLLLILRRVAGNVEIVGIIQKYFRPNDIVFADDWRIALDFWIIALLTFRCVFLILLDPT